MTETEADWPQALAAAVHDQRGYLGNVVVAVSLLRRKAGVAEDSSALDVLQRVENAGEGILRIARFLQMLAEFESGPPMEGDASLGAVIDYALGECAKSNEIPDARVMGGDEALRIPLSRQSAGAILSAFIDAARVLAGPEKPASIRVSSADGKVSFKARIENPAIPVSDARLLFDGAWHEIGKSSIRGVPLGLFVARRAARACRGELVAQCEDGGVTLELSLPLSA